MMWTSVDQKLPRPGDKVLVAFGNGEISIASLANEDMQHRRDDVSKLLWWEGLYTAFGATHWMPLPENPNEVAG